VVTGKLFRALLGEDSSYTSKYYRTDAKADSIEKDGRDWWKW